MKNSNKKALPLSFTTIGTILIFAGINILPARAFTIFTDRSAWENSVSNIKMDNFDTEIPLRSKDFISTITLDSGIKSTSEGLDEVVHRVNQNPDDRGYRGYVGLEKSIQWDFPEPIFGFGGYFSSTTSGSGLAVSGNFDGKGFETVNFSEYQGIQTIDNLSAGLGFLGIIGSQQFSQVIWSQESETALYGVSLDNSFGEIWGLRRLSLAGNLAEDIPESKVEDIPEPNFVLSLLALGLFFKVKKKR
ncbi:MAG: hypothetical protein RH949_26265 [Coleofasciculus sp. A1-SPW-01]|uniref:hypothetical protein n=1 Tax=Coleofasciculus sp. A1-SPW-01 TaxID=3070819 RepID=UPI0032F57E7D